MRSALGASDIDAILFNEPFLSAFPHLRVASDGYRLSVPASQEATAIEVLAEIETRQTNEPIGADTPCAICGGRSFRRERNLRWTVTAFFLGTGLVAQNRRSRCHSCGDTVNNDKRPIPVRVFFFLSSIAITLLIAWLYAPLFIYQFVG